MNQPGLQFFFLLLFIVPLILFIVTLQNTLKIISPENRKMRPGEVWLTLIPLFGVVWQLVVVSRIADSIRDECLKLNISFKESRPTFTIGAVYCFSFLVYLLPAFKIPASFVVMVTWILYWIEVNKYKKLFESNKGNRRPGS
jgi:hypothetical protein